MLISFFIQKFAYSLHQLPVTFLCEIRFFVNRFKVFSPWQQWRFAMEKREKFSTDYFENRFYKVNCFIFIFLTLVLKLKYDKVNCSTVQCWDYDVRLGIVRYGRVNFCLLNGFLNIHFFFTCPKSFSLWFSNSQLPFTFFFIMFCAFIYIHPLRWLSQSCSHHLHRTTLPRFAFFSHA